MNPYSDILTQIKKISDSSVQAIISRPPIIQQVKNNGRNGFSNGYLKTLDSLDELWDQCFSVLKHDGTLWLFTDNYFSENQLVQVPFTLSKRIQNCNFLFRNIIIWYNTYNENLSRDLINRYSCVLFFSRTLNYKFNLDRIREPHIWKDAEWGGGRRSRYNPKGKNPSNFWLKTKSKKGKTLEHLILPFEEAISRCILCSTDEGDQVLDIFSENSPVLDVVKKLNREPLSCHSNNAYNKSIPKLKKPNVPNCTEVENLRKCLKTNFVYTKTSEIMNEITDSSIQLIITSPPYWGLRDYGAVTQIGFNESYIEYLNRLEAVGKECYRVLRNDGSLWININKRFIKGDILLFPEDITERMKTIGFHLKEIVIWHKPVFVPGTGVNNFTDRHEYILFFSKNETNYVFNSTKIGEPDYIHMGNEGISNVWKMFRKIGNIGKEVKLMINERKIKHTAIYPKELVRRIILLCSNRGDVVLDPFAGSGTTLVMANRLGRKWIGYEINPDYKEIIAFRLKKEGHSLDSFL